jgi:hypothetical protein
VSAPLPGEQIEVHVAISINSDGTVNLAFERIAPEDIESLLCSVGTEEFQRTLVERFNDDIRERRERGEL